MDNLVNKMARIGLDFKDADGARQRRRANILNILNIMPDKAVLLKAGDAEMLADLTEAGVTHILEVFADRVHAAGPSLGTIVGPDLLASLISKFAAEAFGAMQDPLLDGLLQKRAIMVLLANPDDAADEGTTLLSGDDALRFMQENSCPCPSCTEVIGTLRAGTHDLIVRDGMYLGMKRKETVQ